MGRFATKATAVPSFRAVTSARTVQIRAALAGIGLYARVRTHATKERQAGKFTLPTQLPFSLLYPNIYYKWGTL